MALSTWIAIAGVCLLVVSLGLWVIAQIFPGDRTTTRELNPDDPHLLTDPVHNSE